MQDKYQTAFGILLISISEILGRKEDNVSFFRATSF